MIFDDLLKLHRINIIIDKIATLIIIIDFHIINLSLIFITMEIQEFNNDEPFIYAKPMAIP